MDGVLFHCCFPLPILVSGEQPLGLRKGTVYVCRCVRRYVWIVCVHVCMFVVFPHMDKLEASSSLRIKWAVN